MTHENKDLLLKYLCGALPYGIKVNIKGEIQMLDSWCDDDGNYFNFLTDGPESNFAEGFALDDIKPYLRSLSDMSEDEIKEYHHILVESQNCSFEDSESASSFVNDWMLSKHFDTKGLIQKGLAINCANLNIY